MELMREGNKEWGKASAGAGAFILQRKVGMWEIMWENGRKRRKFC